MSGGQHRGRVRNVGCSRDGVEGKLSKAFEEAVDKKKKEETKAATFTYFILYIVFYLTCAWCGVYLLDETLQDSWV